MLVCAVTLVRPALCQAPAVCRLSVDGAALEKVLVLAGVTACDGDDNGRVGLMIGSP